MARRSGSFDPATGAFLSVSGRLDEDGKVLLPSADGTPIPAIVPLPDAPLPPIPTYSADGKALEAMPGYPFYIAGKPGHRAPQAPLDLAQDTSGSGEFLDGGLPRHVLKDRAERKLDIADTPVGVRGSEERRASSAQILAKMLALGNFAGHLEKADLELLPYDGTDAEKAAMAFHHDGAGVSVRDVSGKAVSFDAAAGGYPTVASPAANGGTTAGPAVFHVNGSLPKPGAPFADPCGVSKAAQPSPLGGNDPLFRPQDPYFADPALIGFRRYEASAVQLDMVTNRAGWHDPQARINVLSKDSARFKDNRTGDGLPVSPLVSGTEEPFFFRALSGECIEFRHTNELPKDLERDDFQVRTPTDTIGQHIHLVKFDVTSSDGSGNGWNYEDGTFAADEIAARICAYRRFLAEEDEGALGQRIKANRPAGELSVRMPDGFCESAITTSHSWWRQSLASARPHFQTTVQRWFADPILSPRYGPSLGTAEDGQTSDRTLRTVFTHDHFGPSSIQQHGFYSALLIEPRSARVCEPTAPGGAPNAAECQPARKPGDFSLAQGTAGWTGARKIIDVDAKEIGSPRAIDPTHPDYREYALAIADFATLYDPRDHESEAAFRQAQDGSPRGLQALACEARHRNDPTELKSACGSAMAQDMSIAGSPWHGGEDIPPAWAAAGKPGGLKRGFTLPGILSEAEVAELIDRSIEYRKRAAGNPQGDRLAKPVAPPQRPEAISVDHHDPYLVNYRGEPLPLRVGTKNSDGTVSGDCLLRPIDSFVEALREAAAIAGCSIGTQISLNAPLAPGQRPSGDMADVFLSAFHGDPVTPILEGYDGERIVMRLVQGAQEVQHTFNLEGYTFGRNIDQSFASGHRALETSRALMPGDEATLDINCQATQAAAEGRPSEYALWRKEGTGAFPANSPIRAFWERHEALLERCDNAEGVVTAQEVGISEHFEFSGQFRQASAGVEFVPGARSNVQETTDYLYHFGSKDALWNGAWGLARIFRDKAAPDLSRCDPSDSACNDKAGGRLLALADLDSAPTDEGTAARATRQILSCRADAPRVHAVIAALETARVWPGGFDGEAGTPYGRGLQDRNGLMFALLDPQRLFAPDKAEAALAYDPSDPTTSDAAFSWQSIPLDTIAKLVRDSYARPEPLVLRVNANDCVTLHVINGLTAYRSTGGLKDDRGDAPMPPITPLNVENAWSKVETVETGGAEADQRPESFITGARSDIRPSARLGLSIPLPSLDHTQSVPLPFGQNTTSTLAPARCNAGGSGCTVSLEAPPVFSSEWPPFERRGDSIERLTFYAGRSAMKTAIDSLPVDIAIALDDRLRAEGAIADGRTLTVDEVLPASAPAPFCSTDEGVAVELLGRPFRLCLRDDATDTFTALPQELANGAQTPASAADTLIAAWNAEAKARLAGDDYVHWTPYAFGTLPIKSTGDIIAHGAHGLFGGLIVEPREAVLPEAERHTFPGGIVALKPRDGGRMWVADIRARDMENREHKIREFVLFYQDGLNLRDAHTANRWTSNDGTSRLVADCMVCDDSYDLGDQGVNYRSDPFFDRLRGEEAAGQHPPEAQFNLNAFVFPPRFWLSGHKPHNMPVLRAEAGDEIVVRVIHPGGRARQRNFSLIGNDYDDLFSGFGFPHAALVAPGKGVRAALTRKAAEGCYLWHDGTTTLNAGGTWGLIDVVARGALKRDEVSSCKSVSADVAKPGK
ncbi:MAG: hypothetical protein DI629_05380 [Mesorhizobium amorphae]|nr:MAG: hypothetical protein DI629_05380 [Mesorhizobium amorphae]